MSIRPLVERRARNLMWRAIIGAFALSSALAATPIAAQTTTSPGAPPRFEGRMLVSVSDADMLSSAYDDGDLGPEVGPDMLSVIRLDRPGGEYRAVEVAASNSVTGPPSSVAVTPDGRYAVVIETRGARTDARTTKLSELARGRTITLVDLSRPDRPRVIQRLQGFVGPQAVAIDPTGTLVAIAHRAAKGVPPISLHRLAGGRLSPAATPAIPGWTAEDSLIGFAFHPRDSVLALLNVAKPALSFVRLAENAGEFSLTTWGNTVPIERDPYIVRFTPDGRHALVNGTYAAFGYNLNPNFAPRGSVQSIRVAGGRDTNGAPQHRFVARAETGAIPEGLDVSPDGRFVVTANLERSTPRPGTAQMARYGSMSLIRLDPGTGLLTRVGDFAFDGALPEMAVFDNSSRFVAVTVFNQFDDPRAKGSIDFWRIETDPFDANRTELVKTRHSIPVTRGAHSMTIVK